MESASTVSPPRGKVASHMQTIPQEPADHETQERRPKRTPWRRKFGAALRGIKLGIRGHSSFFVHFFFTALVLAAAVVLRCEFIEWCVLLVCIGGVLTAELVNSAIETLFRGLDEATKSRAWNALDIAAGGVLLASVVAAVVGALIFARRLQMMMWPE
jgi:diacylglycerol kinase